MNISNLLIGFFILVAAAACGPPKEPAAMTWREQVQLRGGTRIVVQRRVDAAKFSEAGGATSSVVAESEVRMESPNEAAGFAPLRTGLKETLLILDRDAEGWYAISVIDWCAEAKAQGLGKRPYLEYRLRNGAWSRQSVAESRNGQPFNLLVRILKTDHGKLLDLKEKQRRHASSSIADYVKQITAVVCPEN